MLMRWANWWVDLQAQSKLRDIEQQNDDLERKARALEVSNHFHGSCCFL